MAHTLVAPRSLASRWSQYYVLTKPRVVQLIVFCALIGMLLALSLIHISEPTRPY